MNLPPGAPGGVDGAAPVVKNLLSSTLHTRSEPPMTQTTDQPTTSTATAGGAFRASGALASGVETILEGLREAKASITDVRPPREELKADLSRYDELANQSRGKGLFVPYVGSSVGNGALVELLDGSVKYDMVCGIGPHFFGHSDEDLARTALIAATSDVHMQGYFQQNADAIDLTALMANEAGRNSRLRHAFLCNSGAMANDNALKIVYQKHHPADRVIAFADCFMGRSVAMCQIGDSAAYRQGVPTTIGVDYMPYFDAAAAARTSEGAQIHMAVQHFKWYLNRYPGKYAAFVFELVQGEGGYNVAPRSFFTALMDVCKENNIAVWADEVQTFGRTGEMFAYETLDLGEYIDICTIGKLSQVCATLFTPEYAPKPGLLSGTFLGGTVPLNIGRRMIERLRSDNLYGESGLIAHHRKLYEQHAGELIKKRPEWFPDVPGAVGHVGGLGGMMRLTPFGGEKDKINALCKHAFHDGVILLPCGHDPYHLRMLPPIPALKDSDWPRIFELIEGAMEKVAG